MISGFVILMTLEKCQNLLDFLFRRWLRLFPAMLTVTIVILIAVPFLTSWPTRITSLFDVLPGLLFVEPQWISKVLATPVQPLDSSFWSLFVEFKFYILFGILYFRMKEHHSVLILSLLFLSFLSVFHLAQIMPNIEFLTAIKVGMMQLSFNHFGWFAAGAWVFKFFKERRLLYCLFGFAMALASLHYLSSTTGVNDFWPTFFAGFLVILLFFSPFLIPLTRRLFQARWIVYFGFISYPLYLLHQNAIVSLINQIHEAIPFIPYLLLPPAALLPIIIIADIAARYVEPWMRKGLKSLPKLFQKRPSVE